MAEITYEFLRQNTIAQDDDCDYSESGYVCILNEGVYEIYSYSHCSCFDTLECIGGGGAPNWSGTADELKELAQNKGDLSLYGSTGKIADPEDYDYDHLMAVYEQVLAHFTPAP